MADTERKQSSKTQEELSSQTQKLQARQEKLLKFGKKILGMAERFLGKEKTANLIDWFMKSFLKFFGVQGETTERHSESVDDRTPTFIPASPTAALYMGKPAESAGVFPRGENKRERYVPVYAEEELGSFQSGVEGKTKEGYFVSKDGKFGTFKITEHGIVMQEYMGGISEPVVVQPHVEVVTPQREQSSSASVAVQSVSSTLVEGQQVTPPVIDGAHRRIFEQGEDGPKEETSATQRLEQRQSDVLPMAPSQYLQQPSLEGVSTGIEIPRPLESLKVVTPGREGQRSPIVRSSSIREQAMERK
ncbi:MAG: hypothetical protein PHY80_01990 [Rickettsiales bacterium]|nr:hypothetical protein [Rickettsiales bacterium]